MPPTAADTCALTRALDAASPAGAYALTNTRRPSFSISTMGES